MDSVIRPGSIGRTEIPISGKQIHFMTLLAYSTVEATEGRPSSVDISCVILNQSLHFLESPLCVRGRELTPAPRIQ